MKKFTVSQYLTPKEAEAIITACPKERDKLIFRTMWETGGRISEVLSLIPTHIDLVNNAIYLSNLKQKGIKKSKSESEKDFEERKETAAKQNKERFELLQHLKGVPESDTFGPPLKKVYLFKESTLCQDLLDYIVQEHIEKFCWVFQGSSRTGQVSPEYIWYLLAYVSHKDDIYKRKNGIGIIIGVKKMKGADLKSAWPHLFRHGAAMNIYHRTGKLDVVQKELGHSSIVTTEGYASLMDEDAKKIIADS